MKNNTALMLLVTAGLTLLAAGIYFSIPQTGLAQEAQSLQGAVNENGKAFDEDPLIIKFSELDGAGTNFCAGPDILENNSADRLQGACCGKMDFHRYAEQVEGLKKYAYIEQIPPDPYDISRELADELLEYQKTIQLTAEQQGIYDDAVKMSHEGGPCCCKCWRWYAFEGLAKYLITEHGFTAEQIAEVWDLEDGCGGEGHAHE